MRRHTAALLSGLLLAFAGTAPVFAADAPLPATVTSTTVTGDEVTFAVALPDVPDELNASSFTATVRIGDTDVPAEVTVTDLAAATRRTAMLAIDSSGSMAGTGISAARAAAKAFVAAAPADLYIGLIAFAESARLIVEPTRNHATLTRGIDNLRAGGDTTLYDAVKKAALAIGTTGDRAILVLSDGADTQSRETLASAMKALSTSGVRADFVAFRTNDSERSTLASLARAGGGHVLAATDEQALTSIYSAAATARPATLTIVATVPAELRADTVTFALDVAAPGYIAPLAATAVMAGSATPSTTASASAAPTPSASTPATNEPVQAPFDPVLAGIAAAAIAAFALVIALFFSNGEREHQKRMQQVIADSVNPQGIRGGLVTETAAPKVAHGTIGTAIATFLNRAKRAERLTAELDGAGITMPPSDWVMLRLLIAITAGLALAFSGSLWFILAPLGFIMGYLAPHQYLVIQRGRRRRAFEAGLPDVLMIIAGSLRAGFSLEQSIAASADQAGSEVSEQMRRAISEVRLGGTLEEALERVANRTGSDDVRWVVTALRIQRRSGGNLAELLTTAANTVRERGALAREVKALTAEGRLSAYILIGLPVFLFGFLYFSRRDYVQSLWTTATGGMLSVAAIALMVVGWVWMQRMIKVEV